MNGKELLQAMSYVDEKYIADAERRPQRRILRWQSAAAMAACLCLVLGAWRISSVFQKQAKIQTTGVVEEQAMDMAEPQFAAAGNGDNMEAAQPMLAAARSAAAQMTVRLKGTEENLLICIVTDPGTGAYPEGTELRIAPPDETEEYSALLDTTASMADAPLLRVTYQPAPDGRTTLQAMEIAPEPTGGEE